MTDPILLSLLAAPLLWTCVSLDPPTICQDSRDLCVTLAPREVLLSERDGDTVTLETLHGPVADVARNLVALRRLDAEMLARDRVAQGLRERARVLARNNERNDQ